MWVILICLLVCLSALISIINPLAQASNLPTRAKNVINGFHSTLYVDSELSVPNWFSSVGLFVCTVLLLLNGLVSHARHKAFSRRWSLLALIFLALSMDEVIALHERTMVLGRQIVGWIIPNFALYNAWVVFAPFVLAAAGLAYWPVFQQLPRPVKIKMLMAVLVYLAGAIGVEVVGGQRFELLARTDWIIVTLVHVEEALEMAGALLFADALFASLAAQLAGRPLEITVT